jgi:hypothetical protein
MLLGALPIQSNGKKQRPLGALRTQTKLKKCTLRGWPLTQAESTGTAEAMTVTAVWSTPNSSSHRTYAPDFIMPSGAGTKRVPQFAT